jgi:hypothetical protein
LPPYISGPLSQVVESIMSSADPMAIWNISDLDARAPSVRPAGHGLGSYLLSKIAGRVYCDLTTKRVIGVWPRSST